MIHIDFRHFVLVAMNILKSFAAQPWDWDPFHYYSFNWFKLFLLLLLFPFFSFVSIQISLIQYYHRYSCSWQIQIHVGYFSTFFSLSLIALLFSPQILFWYVYAIMLLLSNLCFPCIFQSLNSFLEWLQALLLLVPVRNVAVTMNIHTPAIEVPELQIHQPSSDDHGGGENPDRADELV